MDQQFIDAMGYIYIENLSRFPSLGFQGKIFVLTRLFVIALFLLYLESICNS